jgi:predicted RNA-binding Zn-ribbon protein involved in translation (DUF1610 family)
MDQVVVCQACERKVWWRHGRSITFAECPHCGELMQANKIRDESSAQRRIEDPRLQ